MRPTGEIGIYVHFPFCRRRCLYCDFRVDVVRDIPHRAYADAVLAELEARAPGAGPGRTLRSLYFGGGTPSLWDVTAVQSVIRAVRAQFARASQVVEITLEANPEQVTVEGIEAWREAGVNRLSIGLQSLDDRALKWLGREHSAQAAREAVLAARRAGMPRVTFDLICALPGRSLDDWGRDLDMLEALAPLEHVSVYELTFHAATPLGRQLAAGRVAPAPEGVAVDVLERTDAWMEAHGLSHYEVSNYALPGQEAVHNGLYWNGGEYLGLGVGAHSMRVLDAGVERRENTRDTAAYLGDPQAPPSFVEQLDPTAHWRERLFLGLRTSAGVDLARLTDQLGVPIPADAAAGLERCGALGLVEQDGSRLWPTPRGLRMADSIAEAVI